MRSTNLVTLTRRLLVAVGLTAVAVVGTTLPAAAGVPTLTVTPTTLPVGGTITVSNSSCLGGAVEVGLWGGTTAGNALPSGSPVATNTAAPDGTGAWSTTLLVPLSAAPGAYTVHGSCARVRATSATSTLPSR